MKKIVLPCIIFALAFIKPAFAQDSIPNKGFEYWESSGKQPPFDWVQPTGWTSSNAATEFASSGVTKTKYVNTNSFQAQLETLKPFGVPKPGVLVCGNAVSNSSLDDCVDFLTGGVPYTTLENKLYGSYIYNSSSVGDSAFVRILFKKYNTSTGTFDSIAYGEKALPIFSASFTNFEVAINVLKSGVPDSVIIGLYSTKPADKKDGGSLAVDYISFDETTGLRNPAKVDFSLYPNPASSFVNLAADNSFLYSISDISGRLVAAGTSNNNQAMVNTCTLAKGCYIVTLLTEDGFTACKKLIVE